MTNPSANGRFTYRRVEPEVYEVSVDGLPVGRVFRAWRRTGGDGWTTTEAGSTYPNRAQAVRAGIGFLRRGRNFDGSRSEV